MLSDAEKLFPAVRYGYSTMIDDRNFIKETRSDFDIVDAHYDPQDGLPVVVTKVKTNAVVRDHRGEVHPGAFCLILDVVTTFSSFADLQFYEFPDDRVENVRFINNSPPAGLFLKLGISRSIKSHRLRGIPAGSTVYFASKMVESTPQSSFTTCEVFGEDGNLLATGSHDKTVLRKMVKPKL